MLTLWKRRDTYCYMNATRRAQGDLPDLLFAAENLCCPFLA